MYLLFSATYLQKINFTNQAILPDGRSNLSRNIAEYCSAAECSNWSASCGYCSATECSQWARAPRRG